MDIAYVITAFPALSETFILNHVTKLIDLGYNVDIYARVPRREDPFYHSDIDRYSLLEKTTYIREPYTFCGKIIGAAKAIQKVTHADLPKLIGFNRESLSTRALHAYPLTQKKYDVIHCHYGPNGNLVSWLKKRGLINSKVICTFHGYDLYDDYFVKNSSWRYSYLRDYCDRFIAISQETRQQLIENHHINPNRISVVSNGVVLSDQIVRKKPGPRIQLLMVTRLSPEKGIDRAIKAFQSLRGHPVDLSVIGTGTKYYCDLYRGMVDNLNLANVKFLGPKDHNEVLRMMSEFDGLLLTSYTEVLPTVILEAQARFLPVIATNVGAVRELLGEGHGVLVESELDAIIAGIRDFIYGRSEHNVWKSKQNINQYHGLNRVVKTLISIYSTQKET